MFSLYSGDDVDELLELVGGMKYTNEIELGNKRLKLPFTSH
jgi:hypothetical protein